MPPLITVPDSPKDHKVVKRKTSAIGTGGAALEDNRRAVRTTPVAATDFASPGTPPRTVSPKECSARQQNSDERKPASPVRSVSISSCCPCLAYFGKLFAAAEQDKAGPPQEPARRWYRVQPLNDNLYSVRADPGIAGRVHGHPDAKPVEDLLDDPINPGTDPVQSHLAKQGFKRAVTVSSQAERFIGLDELPVHDPFFNVCKICFTNISDVVVLPCKHGGMCEACLVKSLRSRPFHRGGTQCPICRKQITEVIKLHNESAINMYGYAVRIELLPGIALRS